MWFCGYDSILLLGLNPWRHFLTLYFYHAAPIDNIKNWSNVQLMEDENNDNSVSTAKYNECWRWIKAHKEEVEWRAWEEAEQIA